MSYEFYFTSSENDGPSFTRILESVRCECITARGTRCDKVVTIGLPYCEQHQESVAHVRIIDSPGRGKGLSSVSPLPKASGDTIVFRRGDVVFDEYVGEHISKDELERRYGEGDTYNAPYAIILAEDVPTFVDAACKRGLASMINHARLYDHKQSFVNEYQYANCIFRLRENVAVYVEAVRDIFHGEELLVDYGGNPTSEDDSHLYTNPPDISTGTRKILPTSSLE